MELQVIEQNVIVAAYSNENGAQALFDQIKAQAASIVPDVATAKGRKEIASLAHTVSKTKTAFDAHGKTLKEQYTVITSRIDADRKLFRDQCDQLRDDIRQPLTDWENAEKARVEKHKADIEKIQDFAHPSVIHEMSASRISEQIRLLDAFEMCELFEEFQDQAKLAKFETLEKLRTALAVREKHEAEQAELEKLQVAEQVRIQQERDAQIALEATQKAQRDAEEKARAEAERVANEQRQAAEKAERDRVAAAQREAALQVEKEAVILREQQAKAHAEQQAKQAEIDKQQAIEAERKRIEQQQIAEAERVRKEAELREADVAHKKQVCGEALKGLTDLGVEAELGRMILNAINKGKVPHVSIKF